MRTLLALAITTLIACLPLSVQELRADAVFDNTSQVHIGGTWGQNVKVGASLLTGPIALTLNAVTIPQTPVFVGGETYGYSPVERFALYSRNGDGTLGSLLFSSFSLSHDATINVTTATASLPFVLLPNTGYWFVLDSNGMTNISWDFTSSANATTLYGIAQPTTRVAYFRDVLGPRYFNLTDGPQQYSVDASPIGVPEPSTWALIAGGVGTLLGLQRARRGRKALV